MKHKFFRLVSLIVVLVMTLSFSAGQTQAQKSQPDSLTLGQPGLSFRYQNTLGSTQSPYISDHTHLNFPVGLTVDSSNNVYITEDRGKRLLKFSSTGNFLYSIGTAGFGSTEIDAFGRPQDSVTDSSHNVWVADNNRVVKYDSDGVFLLQFPADSPWQSGSENGRFNDVDGIAFDSHGRMYVSDSNNQRVQVFSFDTNGVPVWAKNLGITWEPGQDNNHFNFPQRIAIGNDQLFVADGQNHRVQVYDVSSSNPDSIAYLATIGESGVPGNDNNHFDYPYGVAVNSDYILVTEGNNNRVQVFRVSDRQYVGTAVTFGTGPGGTWNPHDAAFDSAGNIYIADSYNHRVQFFTKGVGATWSYSRIIGTSNVPYITDEHHFNKPRVAIDLNNNLIVLEEDGQRLLKFAPGGNLVFQIGTPGIERDPNRGTEDNFHFHWPHAVAVDQNGKIYVADNCRIQIYSPAGDFLHTVGTGCGTGDYQFNWATGVAVDKNGFIYVADYPNHRVEVFNASLQFAGRIGETGVCNPSNDHLCIPIQVAVDSSNNVYVTDAGNGRVQKFDNSFHWLMTIGGSGGNGFDQFNWAEDVAVDSNGRIYVTDWNNNRVQVFDVQGAYLTTIGGAWGANSSQFTGVSGVDIDSLGNVYVADWQNSRIQVFALGVPGWKQANINGFGEVTSAVSSLGVFNGQIYAGTANWSGVGGRIYRSSTGADWVPVVDPGFGGGGAVPVIVDLKVFNGKLYAATGWGDNGSARIYRSDNGATWNQVVSNGFGDASSTIISQLTVFNNQLYAAVLSDPNGAQVWRSSTGNTGDWTRVATGGFNDPHNGFIQGAAIFNGFLYCGIINTTTGNEIWRSNNGTNWEQVGTDGFGSAENNNDPNLQVFNNQIYVGMSNATIGAQVWRSSNGTTFEPVTLNGFGNPANYSSTLFAFEGSLIAMVRNSQTGVQTYRSIDGMNWNQSGTAGFGYSNNYLWSNSSIAIFNDRPFVATYNWANGGEVWQYVGLPTYLPMVTK
jgi:sugar lactone lactonase YvrE